MSQQKDAYDAIDRFLRNNLGDDDYADYSQMLDALALPDAQPVGYLPAYELGRLRSGHNANLKSAKFGPSPLDDDVPVYLVPPQPATAPEPVRLTDEEIPDMGCTGKKEYDVDMDMWVNTPCRQDEIDFARAIEAALHAKASKP